MKWFCRLFIALLLCSATAHAQNTGMIGQINGNGNDLTTGNTSYLCVSGSSKHAWTSTEAEASCISPIAQTFSNLNVLLSGSAVGGGASRQFTLMLNGVAQTLDCSITAGTVCADTTHAISVAAGDKVSLRQITTGTLSTSTAYWAFQTQAANANEYALMSSSISTSSIPTGSATQRWTIPQGDGGASNSLTYFTARMPTAGVLSRLYYEIDTTPAGSDTTTATLYINGSPTALTAQIANGATRSTDLSHTVSVSAGDLIYVQLDQAGTWASARKYKLSMKFAPTTDGESIALFCDQTGLPQNNAGRYNAPAGGQIINTTEANVRQATIACTLKKLYAGTNSAVGGSGQTYTTTVDTAGGATAITCGIASGATTCNDTTHTQAVSTQELISIKESSSATTGTVLGGGGIVLAMATATPAAPTPTATPTNTPIPGVFKSSLISLGVGR